jgi:hypothetical protein
MLSCVLFVQEWRIEFELKREVCVVGLLAGVDLEDGVKHKINVGLCFILCKIEDRI